MVSITKRIDRLDEAEVQQVVGLLRAARELVPDSYGLADPDHPNLQAQLAQWLAEPETSLIVHDVNGEYVGVALARRQGPGLFADVDHLHVELILVAQGHRRRGVGRGLILELALIARQEELPFVLCTPITGERNELRYLSGLGFAPAGVRRLAQTSALLRRLETPITPHQRRVRSLDDLIARRRRAREIENTPPHGSDLSGLAGQLQNPEHSQN